MLTADDKAVATEKQIMQPEVPLSEISMGGKGERREGKV